MELCEEIVRRYMGWLGRQFTVVREDDACVVVTPYEDPWGDLIEVKLSSAPGGGFLVSDRGAALDNLFLSGVDPSSSANRQRMLEAILQDNKVRLENGQVVAVAARKEELPCSRPRFTK